MRYHLDTIPVWDAFKQDEYCPFCSLYRKREVIHVERTLGGAVMEPDTRITVNELGFCPEHHRQLYALQNRLGHALIMESHLKVLTEKAEKILASAADKPRNGLFKKDAPESASLRLRRLTESCVICGSISNDMAQYAYTAAALFEKDGEFAQAFEKAHLCLEHLSLMTEAAEKHLGGSARGRLIDVLRSMLKRDSEKIRADVSAFTRSFDYRNALSQDIPKNALEKAVNFSRTRCLGPDPANDKRN